MINDGVRDPNIIIEKNQLHFCIIFVDKILGLI